MTLLKIPNHDSTPAVVRSPSDGASDEVVSIERLGCSKTPFLDDGKESCGTVVTWRCGGKAMEGGHCEDIQKFRRKRHREKSRPFEKEKRNRLSFNKS